MSIRRTLTTGIGSLPFTSVDVALEHIFRNYDVPFFPQLPQLSQTEKSGIVPMLREALTGPMLEAIKSRDLNLLNKALDEATENPHVAEAHVRSQAALPGFLTQVARHRFLKLQVIGPASFGTLVASELGSTGPDRLETRAWMWIEALTRAWIHVVRSRAQGTILFLWDDVLLAAQSRPDILNRFDGFCDELVAFDTTLGVHTCAPGDLIGMVRSFPGSFLSIDMNVVDFASDTARHACDVHLSDGGWFMFGVYNTQSAPLDKVKGRQFAALARTLVENAPPGPPLLFSGGCGTGLMSEAFEIELAQALAGLRTP